MTRCGSNIGCRWWPAYAMKRCGMLLVVCDDPHKPLPDDEAGELTVISVDDGV